MTTERRSDRAISESADSLLAALVPLKFAWLDQKTANEAHIIVGASQKKGHVWASASAMGSGFAYISKWTHHDIGPSLSLVGLSRFPAWGRPYLSWRIPVACQRGWRWKESRTSQSIHRPPQQHPHKTVRIQHAKHASESITEAETPNKFSPKTIWRAMGQTSRRSLSDL